MRLSSTVVLTFAALAIAGPALSQSRVQVGQTVSGELSTSDPTLSDGSHFDCYDLQTQQGQRLQIDQTSTAFDSFLSVVRGGCGAPAEILVQDDDGGGELNSRVTRDGDGSLWALVVNSLQGGSTGAYQLRVTAPGSGGGGTDRPPASRPADPVPRYTWDMICMAADQYAKIHHGVDMDDPDSIRIMQAANGSGEALGKDFQTVSDELLTFFMPYTADPRAYFNMSARDLRAHCIGLL